MQRFDFASVLPLAVIAALFALAPLVLPAAHLPAVTRLLVISGAAISLNVMVGATGLLSMGQGLFLGLGAYAVALGTIRFRLDYWTASALALALAVPLAALVALVSLRARHLFFGLITMAIGQVGFVFVSRNYQFTGGDDGLVGVVLPRWLDNDFAQHFFALGVFLVVGLMLLKVLASPFGAMLSAVRDNPNRVASLGGNPKTFEFVAMLLASVLGTLFGALWSCTEGSVEPGLISWVMSAMLLMMVALGGRSLFIGPVIGAAVLELSRDYVQAQSSNADLVVGLIVIACAVFFPEGLGLAFKALARRLAPASDAGTAAAKPAEEKLA